MARLNEPPVAPAPSNAFVTGTAANGADSVEALKRRFIRQNRELAKNNSSQSLRIRSLELEVSKLLGDNLELRERVLSLQSEAHNARRQAGSDAIRKMRHELRVKLAELSGLVDGFAEQDEEDRLQTQKDKLLSPSQRQYRERQPLAELMQDAVMPTIAEDKQYPRRTLEPEEVRSIRLSDQSASTGSPDIGPPPVAHFELGSSHQNGTREEPAQTEQEASPSLDEEQLLPSINLETRRKRRDGGSKIEIRRHSIVAPSHTEESTEAASKMLRTGAKRKLADRETVDKPIKPPSSDDFTFSRRASAVQPLIDEGAASVQESVREVEAPMETAKPARKILGEKSVNMSPKKAEVRGGKNVEEDLKKTVPPRLRANRDTSNIERPPTRGRRVSSIPLPSPHDEMPATIELPPPEPSTIEQLMPGIPAAQDIFSPISEPSANDTARDTPPPSSLSSAINTTSEAGRPSRRARPAVSYKEPSLNAKMRRPGKEMVDAISGLQDPKRVMSATNRTSTGTASTSITKIKTEPEDDDAWRNAPSASPLRGKSTNNGPEPVADNDIDAASLPPSSASSALSSVIATSRKRREQLERRASQPFGPNVDAVPLSKTARRANPHEKDKDSPNLVKKLEELDLYDFKDSSDLAVDANGDGAPVAKSHRRHSSMPKQADTGLIPAAPVTASRGERANRRKSMML